MGGTPRNPFCQRLSRNELENEVVNAPRLLQAIDRSDVRMIERQAERRLKVLILKGNVPMW